MSVRYILLSSILAGALHAGGCQKTNTIESSSQADARSQLDQPTTTNDAVDTDTVVLQVHGMSCPLCSANVDKQLLRIPGVEGVNVNLNTGRVLVQVSKDNPPTHETLESAITESGFTLVGEPQPQ